MQLKLWSCCIFLAILGYCSQLTLAQQQQLKIEVLEKPTRCQQTSQRGQQLSMLYKGMLTNGKVFDSSLDRRNPFMFKVGVGQVIKGWDQGLIDMCVGEKRRLTIPPHLAYGDRGAGSDIPPGATLVFETELIRIGDSRG